MAPLFLISGTGASRRDLCLIWRLISVAIVCLAFYLGAEQRFDPGQLVRYDFLCVLGDRLLIPVEGSRGLTERAACPVQPAEYREATPFEKAHSVPRG